MRYLLTLLFGLVLCTGVRAQVGVAMDAEYVDFCMVDSLVSGELIRFRRLVNVATLQVVDINPLTGSEYTPSGFLRTCEEVAQDRMMTTPEEPYDPVQDVYSDCNCNYTISQENHEVTAIRGGTTQNYTVEFQEVVRRLCSGEVEAQEISRQTLSVTKAFEVNDRYDYNITYGIGDFVSKVNFLRYPAGSTTAQLVVVDLNPATVTSTYPGLGLSAGDFSYDGSNLSDIAVAYNTVLDFVFPGASNRVEAYVAGSLLAISTQIKHEPSGEYVILPGPQDVNYQLTGTAINNNQPSQTVYGHGLTTNTTNYETGCGTINTSRVGIYFTWLPTAPRTIVALANPNPAILSGFSNPSRTCDAPPALCALLDTEDVNLASCVTICDTVTTTIIDTLTVTVMDTLSVRIIENQDTCITATQQGHQQLSNTTGNLLADTYNSVSLTVISGTVSVSIDGVSIDYPAGLSLDWSAPNPCDRLSQSFTIDATQGSVIIATLE
jgi:hypothetical protein